MKQEIKIVTLSDTGDNRGIGFVNGCRCRYSRYETLEY